MFEQNRNYKIFDFYIFSRYFLDIFPFLFFSFSCIKKQTHQFDKTSFNLKSDNWFQEHPIHRSISRKLIRSPSVFSSERDGAKMVQTVGRWLEEAYQNRIGFQRKEEETYRRLKSLREEKTKGQLFCPLFLYYQLFPLDGI